MRYIPLILLAACATPYQAKGVRGGYQDEPLGDGTYLVTVNVNGYTSSATAFKYFERRAHEVCVQHGFQTFRVIEDNGVGGKIITGRIKCAND